MALNPNIALQVQPPQFQTVPLASPLEQYGKILTLRNMMRQGQLTGLQMQKAQQEIAEGQRNLGYLTAWSEMFKPQPQPESAPPSPTSPMPVPSVSPPLAGGQLVTGVDRQGENIYSLDSGKSWLDSRTRQPVAADRLGEGGTAYGSTVIGNLGGGQTATVGAGEPTPKQPTPALLPTTTFATTAIAETPPSGPSDAEILYKLGPKLGPDYIQRRNQAAADKALEEQRSAQMSEQNAERLSAVIQGVLDVDTPEGYQFGLDMALRNRVITPDVYREYQGYDFNNPQVKDRLRLIANAGVKTVDQLRSAREQRTAEAALNQQDRTAAGILRGDWIKIATPFQNTVDAYGNIQAVRDMDAPIADSILVRQTYKLLEPNSAVLGAEQRDIEMRRSLTDFLENAWNNIKSGHRLTPDQKQQLLQAADNIYGYRQKLYSARLEDYENMARDQKLNPLTVVNRFEKGLVAGPTRGGQEEAGLVPQDVKKALIREGDGVYKLPDGSTWKKEEGIITRVQPGQTAQPAQTAAPAQGQPQTSAPQAQPKAATPQALPGKILVLPPDPGAKPIYIDADKWPAAEKLGFRKQ